MNVSALIEGLDLGRHVLALALGLPRLALLVAFSPFMAGAVLNGQLKSAVILALYLIIHPVLLSQIPAGPDLSAQAYPLYLGLVLKETLLGYLMAYISGIIFWAAQSAGFLMDNQRGASMANATDPLSGDESSPLGALMFQSLVFIFFASGAFVSFLGVFYQSYLLWPPLTWLPDLGSGQAPLFFIRLVDWLMLQTLLLAGPVVVASLLTDVALGLINRFASQLNVYVLSMPIKSGLTMLIIIFYYIMFIHLAPGLFGRQVGDLSLLRSFWP